MEFFDATGINALIITILTLLLALRVGQILLSRLSPPEPSDYWETLFLSIGLGLGFISFATFLLAAVGLLYRPVFLAAFVLGLGVSVPGVWREFRALPGKITGSRSWLAYPVIAFLAGITIICLLAALAPETGFDALNYQLGTPRLYIANHGIVDTENLAGYSHPLAVNMLYVFAWLIHSSLAAKLIHLAFGLLTAAGCWVFCRRYAAPGSGALAALLFLASPIVMFLCHTAYADLGLAFFALLAVFAVFRWIESGVRHWIVLAGIYSGFNLGAKYMGAAVVVVVLAIALVVLAKDKQRRRILVDLCLYCGVTLLVLAPWLIKNWIMSGNPVAPALSNIIPTRGFSSPDYDRLVQLTRSWHGYSGTLLDWILVPWRQTFRPDIFHGSPGIAYLLLFPVAVVLSWRNRWLQLMALCVAVGYLFLLLGTATTRFFVLVFPWVSILIAGAVWPQGEKRPAWGRQVLVLSALALVAIKLPWFSGLGGIPEPLVLDTHKIKVFRTEVERDRFLEAKALGPGGNDLYKYLEDLPKGTRILALTPVYQALTDHEVFMPPNSTPSSEMATAAIELAKAGMGLKDIELTLGRPRVMARFWKIRLNGADSLTPDETRPRLFYIENQIPMEIAAYGIEWAPPRKELLVDLGAPSRVERITLLSRQCGRAPRYEVFASADSSEGKWQGVAISLRVAQPPGSRDRFMSLLAENRITHVVLGHHAGAQFLPEFYVKRHALPALTPVKSFGDYEVLAVER